LVLKNFIQRLSLQYLQLSLEFFFFFFFFFWIGRIKYGFKFDVKPYINNKMESEDCPTYYLLLFFMVKVKTYLVLYTGYSLFKEFRQQFIHLVNKIFINFFPFYCPREITEHS